MSIHRSRGAVRMTRPPRAVATGFEGGMALGEPGDEEGHRALLKKALDLLELPAPQEVSLP